MSDDNNDTVFLCEEHRYPIGRGGHLIELVPVIGDAPDGFKRFRGELEIGRMVIKNFVVDAVGLEDAARRFQACAMAAMENARDEASKPKLVVPRGGGKMN
jgi:hypothetical protein